MKKDLISVAAQLMNFDVEPKTHDEFHQMMYTFLEDLVLNRTERLPHTLYRLDISESGVQRAFEGASSTSDLILKLTDLLIERLEAIALTRAQSALNNRDD